MKTKLLTIGLLTISTLVSIPAYAATMNEVEQNDGRNFAPQNIGNLTGIGHTIKGKINAVGDQDSFIFTVTTPVTFQAKLTNSVNQDADLVLFEDLNNDGFLRGGDSQAGSSLNDKDAPEVIRKTLQPGTYIVQVQKSDGIGFDNNYTLDIVGAKIRDHRQ